MILATVGTHNQGFERLVRAADALAAGLEEPVVIQYGSSRYIPQHARAFAFTNGEEMADLVREARVVVSHAAAGSIILALRMGKPLVVVPRMKAYSEHFDDHQLQLARALGEAGRVVVVSQPDLETLRQAIQQASGMAGWGGSPEQLVLAVSEQMIDWARRK